MKQLFSILINPFQRFTEKQLLVFGLPLTILGSWIAYIFQGRFDGYVDLHFVEQVTFVEPLIDNVINIVVITLLLFVAARIVNRKSRIIDLFCVALIARIPYYLLTFSNSNQVMQKTGQKILQTFQENPSATPDISSGELFLLLIFTLFVIVFLVWVITLLFNGFKVAANAKGSRSIVLFIAALIFGEILSKYLIYLLN